MFATLLRVLLILLAGVAMRAFATAPPPPGLQGADMDWRAPPRWRPPVIQAAGAGQPIELRQARVRTTAAAGQAHTEVELVLFNPNPRVLEGELQFPLLEGQVVTGFALDVNGRLRDAVPLPKARGQEIFEDIRRRGVDPGLLEATAGNQYKLRVYPLPARGERRVRLIVDETLPARGDRGTRLLRLPLAFGGVVGQLDLSVDLPGVQPVALGVLRAPAGLEQTQDGQGTRLRLVRQAWTAPEGAAGWLQLALPATRGPQVLAGETEGRRYVAVNLPFADEPARRPAPRHLALVWDASASSAGQARVLPLLDAWFRSQKAPVRVSLLVVRNRVEPVRTFTVAPQGFATLAEVLKHEPLDGSSNFDELPIPPDVDATFFVSDGLATDGRRRIGYRHSAPLFAINAATAADVPRLTRLAERTGGAFVDATLPREQALRALTVHGWTVQGVSGAGIDAFTAPSLRVREGRIAFAARMLEAGPIDVTLAHPDGRRRTLHVVIPERVNAGRWPGQQWAQWRIAALTDDADRHAGELRRLAAEHGIVGPNSSLIVLELAADYARYELPAPADIAQEVDQVRQQLQARAKQDQRQHLEAMVRQFDERQRWWEREFAKDLPEQQKKEADASMKGGLGEAPVRRDSADVRQRAPAAAPAPAPAPAAVESRAMTTNAAPGLAAQKALADNFAPASPRIALQAATADSPALRRLLDAPNDQLYAAYLDERPDNATSSAFFMDAAGVFLQRGQVELGLRVLSNLAEMNLESRQLLRLYAYRLVQAKQNAVAVPVFERVAALAPNEPQSWRDLGLALAEAGEPQKAVDNLWEVVSRPWHGRFAGVNMIALAELNAIAAQAQASGRPLDLTRVDPRLQRNLPLALRIVLAWDTDDTDMDLWVTDPNGERASYAHRLTFQGGAMSPDATGGYGPEEFALKTAKPGKYLVQAQFYGHRQQVLSAGTTVMVRVTTGFGTPAARDEWITLRFTRGQEVARVGEIDMP